MTPMQIIARGCKAVAKRAPGILTALGIGGYGASVFLAARAAGNAETARNGYLADGNKKKFIRGYVRAWAPTALTFTASTAAVLGGHHILRGRYIAVGTALGATERAFAKYRERVVASEGIEKDIQYRYGLESAGQNGTGEADETTTSETATPIVDPRDHYIQIFDERNGLFVDGDPHGNIARLRNALRELNILYDAAIDGRITYREALTKLGFKYALGQDDELAKFSGRVGWNHRENRGDGYISIGPMFEKLLDDTEYLNDYVMGRTPPLILEFNCDGDIYGD